MHTDKDIHTHTHTPDFDIPLIQRFYDFYKLLYGYLKLFPKKDRYTLGQKLDSLTLTIFELILMAGTSQKDKKLLYLEKAIISLDLLKILLRLAKDVQSLDNNKYLQLEQFLQEVGRMLGGWKRSLTQI